jgi:hypothetical protein
MPLRLRKNYCELKTFGQGNESNDDVGIAVAKFGLPASL